MREEAPVTTGGPARAWWLGVDIGGTRTKLGVVSGSGQVEAGRVEDTGHLPFAAIWELVLGYATEHGAGDASSGLAGIGIAAPGIVDPVFGVRNLPGKVVGIEGFPLRERLEERFGVPVRCVNDGAAATLAEWRFGAARGHQDVVGLTIGTGVGCGVVMGGQLLVSRNLGAGISFGHATIEVGGRTCLCGNVGCVETRVSATSIVGRLRDYAARRVPSSITTRYDQDPGAITFEALVQGVREQDRVALEVMAEFQRDLGATIVTAIHAFDPEMVVLAGGPLAAAELFLPQVQAYVDRYAFRFPKDRVVPIMRAERSDHAGVLGAVALVMQAGDGASGAGEASGGPVGASGGPAGASAP